MKKILFLFLFALATYGLTAQTIEGEKYLLTTKTSTVGLVFPTIVDPYLSPIAYGGFGVSYNLNSKRYLNSDNLNLSMESKLNLSLSMLMNPSATSAMLYTGANYGWGLNYHFRITPELMILTGGMADFDFGLKEVPRNVNNPMNLDMAANLNGTALFMYNYQTRRKMLHLEAAYQVPLLGCMFVPYAGASYYELFDLGDMSNTMHFSSLHNRLGFTQQYTVDVPFRHSEWRFGLKFQSLKYEANNMVFQHNETSLIVGTRFDVISFTGIAKPAPSNFLSTKK